MNSTRHWVPLVLALFPLLSCAHRGPIPDRVSAILQSPDLERSREGAIIRGPRFERRLALVFTGHEHAESGGAILDALARHRAPASFFLTGDFLRNPQFQRLLSRISTEGHYLGPHSDKHLLYCSWSEPRMGLISKGEFRKDFARNLQALKPHARTRQPPHFFLPPYEHFNRDHVQWAAELSYVTVNFTPGTRANADYTGEAEKNFVSSETILASILERERTDPAGLNGFILLLHMGSGPGRRDKFHHRFGELLDRLAERHYRFIKIDELLAPPWPSSLQSVQQFPESNRNS